MRAKTILTLCCFLTLLFVGAALSAETAPAPAPLVLDDAGPAPVCAAKADLGGPVAAAACPANVWQACYQRYGTCMLCFCLGSACECENRCV